MKAKTQEFRAPTDREKVLERYPGATCHRKDLATITYHAVWLSGHGREFACAGSARAAWALAWRKLNGEVV